MAKVKLKLRKHDGEGEDGYPIVFYIRYNTKPYYKRTGYFSKEKHWSESMNNVRGSHPKGVKLQTDLENKATDWQITLTAAEREGLSFTDAWEGESNKLPAFSTHFENRIQELYQAKDLGNMRTYQVQLKWLRDWIGKDVISFKDINYSTLRRLIAYSDGLGHSYYTLNQRLRTYAAVWNDAARRWPKEVIGNPFEGLMADRKPERKAVNSVRHQSIDDIKKLLQYKPANKGQQRAIDCWLLAFALRGAGIIDVLYFDADKIVEGYYPLKRLKMPKKNVVIDVKITPMVEEIIERHQRDYNPYLFDLVKVARNDSTMLPGKKLPEGTRQYDNARTNIDTRLKGISKNIGLKLNLSMLQARHSWIVAARDLGIAKEVIEQCVGHQGQSVMDRHYYGQFEQQVLDEANEAVLGLLEME